MPSFADIAGALGVKANTGKNGAAQGNAPAPATNKSRAAGNTAAAAALGAPAGMVVAGRQLYAPAWFVKESFGSGMLAGLFYTAITLFILSLLLIVIHFTVYPVLSFTPGDGGIFPVPVIRSDMQKAFTNDPAPMDASSNFVNTLSCEYSIGFDVYLTGVFQNTTVPRVLLYRSNTGRVQLTSSDTSSTLEGKFSSKTNLLVWVDPGKNDLKVSCFTGSGTPRLHSPPATIENIPVRKVFRITLVVTGSFIEVYLDGKLRSTLSLPNQPTDVDGAPFFTPVERVSNNIVIGSMYYWPRVLTAGEVRAYGAPVAKDTFFTGPAR